MQSLTFLKKYPMSILLAIIAINLFFLNITLKENGKFDVGKHGCAKYYSYKDSLKLHNKKGWVDIANEEAKKIGIPPQLFSKYCLELYRK